MAMDFSNYIDLILVTFLLYSALVWLKRTRSSRIVFGFGLAGLIYVIARQFNLVLTTAIFQGFFTVILIAVVVIFQQEIRGIFEHIAMWSLGGRFFMKGKSPRRLLPPETETLAKALFDLAGDKIGALVVIHGKDPLERHIEGGTVLKGYVSDEIVKSIFDTGSVGHDGAIIVDGNMISKFGCHLPLSKNLQKLGKSGTRHAAALGLSEVTDALCLVVSEEKGAVSAMYRGERQVFARLEDLLVFIEIFYNEVFPPRTGNPFLGFLKRNPLERVSSVVIALVLWFVLVYGSEIVYESYRAEIQLDNLPPGLAVSQIEPGTLDIAFSAPRRMFYNIKPEDIYLKLDAAGWKKGQKTVRVIDSDVHFPSDLVLRSIGPNRDLKILIEPGDTAKPDPK